MSNQRRGGAVPKAASSAQSPVTEYDIRLIDVTTRTVNFRVLRTPRQSFDQSLELRIDKNSERIDDTSFEVVLSVTIIFNNRDERPFDAQFAVAGTYSHKKGLPDEVVSYLKWVNGPVMLWPYMRELIASITGRAGYAPLVIETLDVSRFARSQSQEANTRKQSDESTG